MKIGTKTLTGGKYKRINEFYKSQEIKDTYKISMMHILLDLFKKTNGIVVVPSIINKRAFEYLTETHDVLKWFYDTYERIDDDEEEKQQNVLTYISIKDIVSRLKESTYNTALNVTMKQKISFNYVRNLFKDNELFIDDYVESIEKIVNKVRIRKLNLLKNWKLIADNDSETKEYNEVLNSISTDNPLNDTDTTNNPPTTSTTSTTTSTATSTN